VFKRFGIVVITAAAIAPLVLAVSGCDAVFGLDEILPQCTDESGEAADGLNAYQCVCECEVPAGNPQNFLVASSDDAEQEISTGIVVLTGLALDFGSAAGPQKVGIRFPAIGVPRGSTILQADLRFWVSTATTGTSVLQIRGQKSGDALPFTTAAFDVTDTARRPLTSAVASWTVPDWPTSGVSGNDQISPDLASVIQEVIDLDAWRPGNALAFIVEGSGRRSAVSFDGGAARAPILRLIYETNQSILSDLFVCMPEALNPNLGGSGTPDQDALDADCRDRVAPTVSGMAAACGYPSTCTCTATPASAKLVCGCNDDCGETVLATDCSNFHPPSDVTATNAAGGTPICTARSPLAAALYGQRSRCEVTGDATLSVEGETAEPSASGVVDLEASGCPGASCAVGMKFALDLGDATFGNFWSSATFTDLASVGGSLAGQEAGLGAGGAGQFAPGATLSTGRGRRDAQVRSVVTPNLDPLAVEADFTPGAATCRIHGDLAGTADPEAKRCQNDASVACTTDADCPGDCTEAGTCPCLPIESAPVNFAIDVSGSIVNQPPTANAGLDQTAECSITGGARVVLDGSASSDPDGNIADERWFRGTRAGPLAGSGPAAVVEQLLGTQVSYVLRVIDGRGQADEDTTSVQVVDTKAPEVACNTPTPNTITPPRAAISFSASAVDVCDAAVTPTLSDPKCFSITRNGKIVDRTSDKEGCKLELVGDTITIVDSGGVDDFVTWKATATDDSGNSATAECEIHVLKPPPR
jgi:hypothetical protein